MSGRPSRLGRLICVLAVAGVAEPAAAARPGCSAPGARTVAENGTARVYVAAGSYRLYGCLRATGRRMLLEDAGEDTFTVSREYHDVRLAGRFVGWSVVRTDESCKNFCPPGYDPTTELVKGADLREGTRRATEASARSLVVGRHGALAWIEERGNGPALRLWPRARPVRTVDSGAISGLRFRCSLLVWRKAGTGHWAAV